MSSRIGATKKKDAGKASQFIFRSNDDDEDDEIRAELEAMTNLEYNLHSDYDMTRNESGAEAAAVTPLFAVMKKNRSSNPSSGGTRDSARYERASEKTLRSENDASQQASGEQELRILMRQAATTSEEKYKILEARDRLMRAAQTNRPSMEKVTRGTCPDMCPEKERLMRESQRRVAPYELMESALPDYRINHETAVKQYSRSSADQEEPLPQDLRPVESLRMTMSYLLHEIADLCEKDGTNLAEWYHFLWDRTRGVRKDITQQELCCPESVQLVEQCARFHIVSAERLCAEEVSVFDKKINTENLTKCLQTLKYMYHDLREEGIICDNEPEFRAYVILLNLNSGNFMWDVQRLPERVQKSPQVRFAMEVHSCVESNNYAKFFRLVRETTYLNACILLRYFNQVRVRAISVMVKAYCRTSSTAFPLYELIDILGFEDENEAVLFCEQLGLNLSKDELHIMLDRRTFSQPTTSIEQGRARNYVESKRISADRSIGLCIAGQQMPDKLYEGHRPHDSFDSRGYLKSSSIDAEDQMIIIDESDGREEPSSCPMDEDICRPAEAVVSSLESKNSASMTPITVLATRAANATPSAKKTTETTTIVPETTTTTMTKMEVGGIAAVDSRRRAFGKQEAAAIPHTVATASHINKKNVQKTFSNDINPLGESRQCRDVDSPPETTPNWTLVGSGSRLSNVFAKYNSEKRPFGEISTGGSIFGNATAVPLKNMFGNAAASLANGEKNQNSSFKSMVFGKTSEKLPRRPSIEKSIRRRSNEETMPQATSKTPDLKRVETLQQQDDRETRELYAQLEAEIIEDICGDIVREEMDRTRRLRDEIFARILDECINEGCKEILDREISFSRKLEEIERRARHRTILKYYGIWREFTRRKRQQRGALDQTPVWLQKRSLEDCAKSLYRDDQRLVIDYMRRKRLKRMSNEDTPDKLFNHQLEYLEPIESKIYEGLRENSRILGTRLPPADIYWKMIVSWPDRMEDRPIFNRYKRITNEYLCPSDHTRVPIVKSYQPNSYETIRICIDVIEGVVNDAARLAGTDGLLLLATSRESSEIVLQRLTSTIVTRGKLMPIPVVVAVLPEDRISPRNIQLDDGLARLVESGYVSEYTVTYEETIDERVVLKFIQDATLWLTFNKSPPIPLEMDHLGKIVDACLTDELWLRILDDSHFNEHLREALRDANFVIDLHNEAVNHLSDIFLDPESLAYTDFPSEFHEFVLKHERELPCGWHEFDTSWRRKEDRALVERTMTDLSLPKWTYDWPTDDSTEFEKSIVRYCDECFGETSRRGAVTFKSYCLATGETSFVQILLEILKEKIDRIEPRARAVYNKNHVRHFRNSPWWFKSGTLTSYRELAGGQRVASSSPLVKLTTSDDTFIAQKLRDEERNEIVKIVNEEYERLFRPATNSVDCIGRETRERLGQLRDISSRLEKTLLQQKSRGRSLEQKLSLALTESGDNSII